MIAASDMPITDFTYHAGFHSPADAETRCASPNAELMARRSHNSLFVFSGIWKPCAIAPIKKAPASYNKAYLHVETDEGDVTYFLMHQLDVVTQAIEGLKERVREKNAEVKETEKLLSKSALAGKLNHRQLALLQHALKNPGQTYTVKFDFAGNPGYGAGTGVKTMRVSVNNGAGTSEEYSFDTTGKTLGNMGWVEKTFTFTASAATTTLTFVEVIDQVLIIGKRVDGFDVSRSNAETVIHRF